MEKQGGPITLSFGISKVDQERRIVSGIATTEVLDKQGDIVDYDGSVEAFREWPGNIREQHDSKKAVGRALHWEPMPDKRAIWVDAYISKSPDGEATWTKVQEGILKGFSVHGHVLSSRPEVVKAADGTSQHANRVLRYRLDELSLVDNPACPEALVHLVKSVNGVAEATDVLDKAVDPSVGGGVDRETIPDEDFAGPDRSYPIVTPADVEDAASLVGKAGDPDAVKRKIIAIAKRKGGAFVAKLPEAWKGENDSEKEKAMGNPYEAVLRKAMDAIERARSSAEDTRWDAGDIIDILNDLNDLLASRTLDALSEENPDPAASGDALALQQVVQTLIQMLQQRVTQGYQPNGPSDLLGGAQGAAAAGGETASAPTGEGEESVKAASARTLMKALLAKGVDLSDGGDDADEGEGKEKETPEQKQLSAQHMHDLAVALGAKCKGKGEGDEEEKANQGAAGQPWPGKQEDEDVMREKVASVVGAEMSKALGGYVPQATLETALGDLEARVKGTLEKAVNLSFTALEERLKALEEAPAHVEAPAVRQVPGGLQMVEKAIGGPVSVTSPGGAFGNLTAEDLSKAAEAESDPFVRQTLGQAAAFKALREQLARR